MSEGYCSFRVIEQVIKEPKTRSTPSESIHVQRASRDTYLLANTYIPSICWLLSGSEPDNSQQVDAYELSVVAL